MLSALDVRPALADHCQAYGTPAEARLTRQVSVANVACIVACPNRTHRAIGELGIAYSFTPRHMSEINGCTPHALRGNGLRAFNVPPRPTVDDVRCRSTTHAVALCQRFDGLASSIALAHGPYHLHSTPVVGNGLTQEIAAPTLGTHIRRVCPIRSCDEVVRSNAFSVITEMKNKKPIIQGAVREDVGKTVSAHEDGTSRVAFFAKGELPIAVGQRASPFPAALSLVYLRPEARYNTRIPRAKTLSLASRSQDRSCSRRLEIVEWGQRCRPLLFCREQIAL
jgi:hypothetical protein